MAPIDPPYHAGWATYLPSTGRIFLGLHLETSDPAEQGFRQIGEVPPMGAETGCYDPDAALDDICALDDDNAGIPVSGFLDHIAAREQMDKSKTRAILLHCRTIAFLPSFIKAVKYPSLLHYMFLPVALSSPSESVILPDAYAQSGPLGDNDRCPDAVWDCAVFDAKIHESWIPGSVNHLYGDRVLPRHHEIRRILHARMEGHSKMAFEALKTIKPVETLECPVGAGPADHAGALESIISANLERHGSGMTHIAIGNRMYDRLLGGVPHVAMAEPCGGAPSGAMLGLGGTTVIVDRLVDAHTPDIIYAVDIHRGAYYGQGPVSIKTDDPGHGNPISKVAESFQYMIADNCPGGRDDRRTAIRIRVVDK
ncbi:hypothetical protein IBTHAUMO2_920007 [Nitrosopumilaceae archaeon]|nr:hypothetical protein IBTHAUMO2_920007 [Nitrosopumilaceae archaeon]